MSTRLKRELRRLWPFLQSYTKSFSSKGCHLIKKGLAVFIVLEVSLCFSLSVRRYPGTLNCVRLTKSHTPSGIICNLAHGSADTPGALPYHWLAAEIGIHCCGVFFVILVFCMFINKLSCITYKVNPVIVPRHYLLPTLVCVRQPTTCVSVWLVYRQSVQRLSYFFNKSVLLIFLNDRDLYESVPRGIAEIMLHWTSLVKQRKWLVRYADTLTWQVTYLS